MLLIINPALMSMLYPHIHLMSVVATTRHSRTNDLTMSKALQWGYQVKSGRITRELNKEPSVIRQVCGQTLGRVRVRTEIGQ